MKLGLPHEGARESANAHFQAYIVGCSDEPHGASSVIDVSAHGQTQRGPSPAA